MKRILYLANLHPNKLGSIEEHALLLARELQRRGDACFMGFISQPEPEIATLFHEAGARILTINCGNTALTGNGASFNIREILALRRAVVENHIDLVHVNFMGLTNPALLGIYLTSARIVYTDHASGLPFHRGPLKELASRMLHKLLRMRVSRYLGVSTYVADRLKQTHHVTPRETATIYNGVNLARFTVRDQLSARERLGFPPDIKIVCAVAMLIPEKGIQYLIDAAALIVGEQGRTDFRLLVVGEGAFRGELELRASASGVASSVGFLGRRSDVHDIVAASDIIAVPCVWEESFGLIIAEAMATGRPVVASRCGGIPELVEHGVTGLLVTPGNSRELADSLLRLMDSPDSCGRLGSAGRDKARRMFDLEKQVVKLAELYDELLPAAGR